MPMTEITLNAVLNLFAIRAASAPDSLREGVRERAASYLRDHLGLDAIQPYLELYDLALDMQSEAPAPLLAERGASVAAGLGRQASRQEQVSVLAALIEASPGVDRCDALLPALAEALSLPQSLISGYSLFCGGDFPWDGEGLDDRFLIPVDGDAMARSGAGPRTLHRPQFRGSFAVFRADESAWFFRAAPGSELLLDGVPPGTGTHPLRQGSVISNRMRDRVHFGEIAAAFSISSGLAPVHVLEGDHLDFRYGGAPDKGLHDFSFSARGGELVAVMGGSGSGKTTLLSLLTGSLRPRSGRLLLDGRDVTDGSMARCGVVGYVPQDDLLFEDLTVFENLYYSARLGLPGLSDSEVRERCRRVLDELNQLDTADLRVGSPLDKTISGGQRKRLNIALELVRRPAVLLVDEPTSGLSSADSVNVVSLLKAQSAAGRLVIAVIHQPSSEVYKMFDRLWMLDEGGRPIYDGNPLDALVHFRSASYRAGEQEYACPRCGNVNPEQLFEIVEERVPDERGLPTGRRRVQPEEWHRLYLDSAAVAAGPDRADERAVPAEVETRTPPSLKEQFAVFFARTMKSRLANRSYRISVLVQPLLLALAAGLLFRGSWGAEYVLRDNVNLPGYYFISSVIAVFLGMALSADEINRDRRILERERLLRLSRGAYLASKFAWLLLAAAVQTALYTVIGSALLRIPPSWLTPWWILFSTAVCASMIGLILSDSLASASAIHILIPVLLAPQIMLGGPAISYDELIRKDAGDRNVPLVAEIMPTRWAYEALMADHYRNNPFQRLFFRDEIDETRGEYLADLYIPEVRGLASYPFSPTLDAAGNPDDAARIAGRLTALRNELDNLERITGLEWCEEGLGDESLVPGAYTREAQRAVLAWLKLAEERVNQDREAASERRAGIESDLRARLGHSGFEAFKNRSFNREVEKQMLGVRAGDAIVLSGARLVPRVLPVAIEPESRLGRAHLFAPFKRLGDMQIPTAPFDAGVLWLMTALLALALHLRLFPRAASALRRAGTPATPHSKSMV